VSTKKTDKRGTIKVTLVRSTIGRPKNQGVTVRSLGLRKLNSSVELPDTDSVRGMVTKVQHLLSVEYVEG
jgi:large subunit ribosomal protein L30